MACIHIDGDLHATRASLARLFGVSDRTVSNWSASADFPQAVADPSDRRRRFYPVSAVIRWRRERDRAELVADAADGDGTAGPLRLDQERALLARAQRRKVDLERAKLEGSLVEVAEARRLFGGMVAVARSKLLGVPSKAKQRIPHLTRVDVTELDELIREALEELADSGTQDAEDSDVPS